MVITIGCFVLPWKLVLLYLLQGLFRYWPRRCANFPSLLWRTFTQGDNATSTVEGVTAVCNRTRRGITTMRYSDWIDWCSFSFFLSAVYFFPLYCALSNAQALAFSNPSFLSCFLLFFHTCSPVFFVRLFCRPGSISMENSSDSSDKSSSLEFLNSLMISSFTLKSCCSFVMLLSISIFRSCNSFINRCLLLIYIQTLM